MKKLDFSAKRALIVGGSRGIGRGVVTDLVDLGAEVFYASRKPNLEEKNAKFIEVDIIMKMK
jgi:NAD(P)-dependent dehydrogenase (short-subunit alcohol dehydrogenase family)